MEKAKFLKVKCRGTFNSFRLPDFHTYHKTLPLPPKTTVAGMLGSALGIGPEEVNEKWLIPERFRVGVVGTHAGKANDLWQIRKITTKTNGGFFTAPIVRELLYGQFFTLYFHFANQTDLELAKNALVNPAWALSLGREDELVLLTAIEEVELPAQEGHYHNTILPFDINATRYQIKPGAIPTGQNLLALAPLSFRLPIAFAIGDDKKKPKTKKAKTQANLFAATADVEDDDAAPNYNLPRQAQHYAMFSFIGPLPVQPGAQHAAGFWDDDEKCLFQLL
jgi:CRISPR-associated protein Cas5t